MQVPPEPCKHPAVDMGSPLGSTIVVRRSTSRFNDWQDRMERNPEETVKFKGAREIRRPVQLYFFWISLFAILIFIFVWPGLIDPLCCTNISKYFRGDSLDINCTGRHVYMYDLPPELNIAVNNESRCNGSLMWWMDLCPRFQHKGYGVKLWNESNLLQSDDDGFAYSQWFDSDFYMLEMIFHTRMQNYRCLTKDPSQADAFFIPYYAGLIALDPLYEMENLTSTFEKRKVFGMDLIDWLDSNGGEPWRKYGGRDHFLILGRTTWDFKVGQYWGTGFSEFPQVKNMTILTLESAWSEPNEHAIPYPTSFHPDSLEAIQLFIERVKIAKRKYLFTYVGAPRSDSWSSRGIISSSCLKAGESVCNLVNCSKVKCSHDPVLIHKAFLQSTFCLQPRGDSATRRSTFDCLISGSIPVFFDHQSAYIQYTWHLPENPKSYSVYIDDKDLRNGVSIQEVLMSYTEDQIEEMRKNILAVIPNLLYNDFEKDVPWSASRDWRDAFEISMERVLDTIAAAKKDERPQTS
ncbi:unnamed protein product [Calypogeia fissa]